METLLCASVLIVFVVFAVCIAFEPCLPSQAISREERRER